MAGPIPASGEDEVLFPELPIVDAHHHLFDRAGGLLRRLTGRERYLVDDHERVLDCGHNFVATVAVESHALYRAEGPPELRSVGETECLNGQAALSATGSYGPARIGAAIVASADLRLGAAVRPVLEAHLAAAPRRLRGVRQNALWDAQPALPGALGGNGPNMYGTQAFRAGFVELAALGLMFDAFVLSPQIADVTSLADAFPDAAIVLNHVGNPIGLGSYAERRAEVFARWRGDMRALAQRANVLVKLGGLGTLLSAFPSCAGPGLPTIDALIADWAPYLETAIELFGADRCMFEGNYPVEHRAGDYRTIWNVFKRVAAGCSADERAALFAGTAARAYRIEATPITPARIDHGF